MPDLPYGREVVPDGSEAPARGGCFVGLRVLSPRFASAGVVRCARKFLAVAALTGLLVCAGVASAHADSLTDRRRAVAQQIAKTKVDLNESSQALSAAICGAGRLSGLHGKAAAGGTEARITLIPLVCASSAMLWMLPSTVSIVVAPVLPATSLVPAMM